MRAESMQTFRTRLEMTNEHIKVMTHSEGDGSCAVTNVSNDDSTRVNEIKKRTLFISPHIRARKRTDLIW